MVKQTSWGPILAAPKARQTGGPESQGHDRGVFGFSMPQLRQHGPYDPSATSRSTKGKSGLIYKYYPLTKIHKNAMARRRMRPNARPLQNHFWPYHDRLFQTQRPGQHSDRSDDQFHGHRARGQTGYPANFSPATRIRRAWP